MNIPPETARAQGHHGIKGAVHGIKGGRPRLDLTDEQRAERRRKQHETYRRRNGIPPKEVRSPRERPKSWLQEYLEIWGKLPGVPLTPEEFAQRKPIWNTKVLKQQEAAERREAEKQRRKLERQKRREEHRRQFVAPPPIAAMPAVGRNQPCPCGSGRKFKKCWARG